MRHILVGIYLLLVAGCATANAAPYIEDLSDDMIKVAVKFGLVAGREIQSARASSDAVALDNCASYNRRSEFASVSHRRRISSTAYRGRITLSTAAWTTDRSYAA